MVENCYSAHIQLVVTLHQSSQFVLHRTICSVLHKVKKNDGITLYILIAENKMV